VACVAKLRRDQFHIRPGGRERRAERVVVRRRVGGRIDDSDAHPGDYRAAGGRPANTLGGVSDPFASTPERSARFARITSIAGIAFAVLITYLAKTLTYKTEVVAFRGGGPDEVHTYALVRGSGLLDWLLVLSPVLISLVFAYLIEVAVSRSSRPAVRGALGLAALSVITTFVVMFSKGVVYMVPWAMALSGSVVLALQALEERG